MGEELGREEEPHGRQTIKSRRYLWDSHKDALGASWQTLATSVVFGWPFFSRAVQAANPATSSLPVFHLIASTPSCVKHRYLYLFLNPKQSLEEGNYSKQASDRVTNKVQHLQISILTLSDKARNT